MGYEHGRNDPVELEVLVPGAAEIGLRPVSKWHELKRQTVLNMPMRYRDISEADANAQFNARRTQRDKLAAANAKTAKASQTYQNTVKASQDSAAAAKRKLSAGTTETTIAIQTTGTGKSRRSPPPFDHLN